MNQLLKLIGYVTLILLCALSSKGSSDNSEDNERTNFSLSSQCSPEEILKALDEDAELRKQVYHALSSKRQNSFSQEEDSKFIKTMKQTSSGAKRIDNISSWLQLGSDFTSLVANVLGYEHIAKNLEKLSMTCKATSGASKVIYGTADTFLTGDSMHLLKSANGVLQLGGTYLQYENYNKHNYLREKKNELSTQLAQIKRDKELAQTKTDPNEYKVLESSWNETQKKYELLQKEQQKCEFQILGLSCSEEVVDKTLKDLENNPNADLNYIVFKNTKYVLLNGTKQFILQKVKENREDIQIYLQNLFEDIKNNTSKILFLNHGISLEEIPNINVDKRA